MSEPQRHTYGARFLRELKQRLQSTAGLKYAAIQALEGPTARSSAAFCVAN